MTDIDWDAIGEEEVRRPGEYRRRGSNGPPYVLDPTGRRTEAGAVRSLLYGRPSGLHRWIEDGFALERWSERMLLVGLCRMFDDAEPIDEGDADTVIARAKHLAGAHLAADRGTAAHEVTHRVHDLEHAERDLIANLAELGLAPELVAALEDAYETALVRWGLEVLTSEVKVVDDVWRLAGTADRFVRLARDLVFGDGTIMRAGTVVVLDLKTGALRVKGGEVMYWHGYAVQLRSYAQGCLYVIDDDGERREPFPWPVERGNGLILHVDLAGALDTDVVTVTLWRVDLEAGRIAGDLACAARDRSKARGIFAQSVDGPVATTVDVRPSRLELELARSLDAAGVPVDGEERMLRAWLHERVQVCGRHELARRDLSRSWPPGVAPPHHARPDELAAIERLLDVVEARHSIAFGPSRPGGAHGAEGGWFARLLDAFPGSTIESTNTNITEMETQT